MTRAERLGALTRSAGAAFVLRGAGTALGFLAHLGLARAMGAEAYGTFVYAYTWSVALGLLAKLGLDRAAVRFGAEALARRAHGEFASLSRLTLCGAAAAGVAVALLFAGGVAVLAAEPLRPSLWIGAVAIPVLAVHQVYLGLAQALKHLAQATVPELILRNGLLALLAAGYWAVRRQAPSAAEAVALHVASTVLTATVDALWMRLSGPAAGPDRPPPALRRQWAGYALQMAVVSNVVAWTMQLDVLLVGALAGPAATAMYSVASRIASFVPWASLAAMTLFAPTVAELWVRGERALLQAVTTGLSRRIAMVSTGMAAALAAAGGLILSAFGADYGAALAPLLVLLAAQALQDWLGPVAALMNYSGHQAQSARVVLAGAALSLALQLVLIPRWGPIGAAIATASAILGNATLMWWLVRRSTGIEPSILGERA